MNISFSIGKIRFVRFLLLVALSLVAFAAVAQPFPIMTDAMDCVLVDINGRIATITSHVAIEPFSEGLAAAYNGYRVVYIDASGKQVFNNEFEHGQPFCEGLAAVCNDELWGYIDTTGKMVIAQQYGFAGNFSEGLACVLVGKPGESSARFGYIDKNGKFKIKPFLKYFDNQYFSSPGEFKSGWASAWLNNSSDSEMPVGFINTAGHTVMKGLFGAAGHFSGSLAPVSVNVADAYGDYGFMDKTGKFVIKPQFDRAYSFSDGLAAVREKTDEKSDQIGKYGYIDDTGKWIIPPIYETAEPFKNGFAKVLTDDTNEGFIRLDGSMIANTRMLQGKLSEGAKSRVEVKKVTASGFLPPANKGAITYKPENVIDGNIATAWVEGHAGDGVGEWLQLDFGQNSVVDSLIIYNGYQRPNVGARDPYNTNLRVAKARIYYADKHLDVDLKDVRGSQTIDMNGIVSNFIKIEITAIYQTVKIDLDCAISEIEVLGRPE